MYSVVLAAALTAGTATPGWGWGCHGCHGCHGCSGCHGAYNAFSYGCHGCWGCSGCYGCSGCSGCWGSSACWGCYGCCGGWTCSGCSGCYGCYASACYGCGGYAVVATAPAKASAGPSAQAQVVVQLPDDARLYVDGKASRLTSSTRRLVTPALEPGQEYAYTLQAVAVRQGRVVQKTKRVTFRAGERTEVRFADLSQDADEQAPARVAVRVPENARLFVDGKLYPLAPDRSSFDSPALEPGRAYSYSLRAEFFRDGQPQVVSRRIQVKAGEQVRVDLDSQAENTARR